jgi:hypothetical protein
MEDCRSSTKWLGKPIEDLVQYFAWIGQSVESFRVGRRIDPVGSDYGE